MDTEWPRTSLHVNAVSTFHHRLMFIPIAVEKHSSDFLFTPGAENVFFIRNHFVVQLNTYVRLGVSLFVLFNSKTYL